jgi:hypothetical protein
VGADEVGTLKGLTERRTILDKLIAEQILARARELWEQVGSLKVRKTRFGIWQSAICKSSQAIPNPPSFLDDLLIQCMPLKERLNEIQ